MRIALRSALRAGTSAAVLAFPLLEAAASHVEFAPGALAHTVHGEFRLKESTHDSIYPAEKFPAR